MTLFLKQIEYLKFVDIGNLNVKKKKKTIEILVGYILSCLIIRFFFIWFCLDRLDKI